MDAPPDKEDSRPYVEIAALLTASGVQAPEIFNADLGQGFLLLSDLGDKSYLALIDKNNCENLYGDAEVVADAQYFADLFTQPRDIDDYVADA